MISVIVPVYNVEAYLEGCVKSILSQTHTDLEILLVDDGSKDGSLALCRQLELADSRIRVLTGPNGGVGHARNRGLEAATGEYIAFVDGDDTIDPLMYETMLQTMAEQGADVVECGFLFAPEDGSEPWEVSLGSAAAETPEKCIRQYASFENTATGPCNKLYRREVIGGIRFPHYAQGEDAWFNLQVFLRCRRKVTLPQCFYRYLQRQRSGSHTTAAGKELDESRAWLDICEQLESVSPELTHALRHKTDEIIMKHLCETVQFRPKNHRSIYRKLRKWYIQNYPKQFTPNNPMTKRQKAGFFIFRISSRFYIWYNYGRKDKT